MVRHLVDPGGQWPLGNGDEFSMNLQQLKRTYAPASVKRAVLIVVQKYEYLMSVSSITL